MSVRRHHHLHGHASHDRYTVSKAEWQELNLHKPILCAMGTEPGAATWQKCMLPLHYCSLQELHSAYKLTTKAPTLQPPDHSQRWRMLCPECFWMHWPSPSHICLGSIPSLPCSTLSHQPPYSHSVYSTDSTGHTGTATWQGERKSASR